MSEVTVTAQNFEKEVLQSDKPVIVDFWASWCGPCRMLAPALSEIAEEHPELKVAKVNVDDEQQLAYQFQISSIPCLIVFNGGKAVNKSVGLIPKEQILSLIRNYAKIN